jgi:hypothetical protein
MLNQILSESDDEDEDESADDGSMSSFALSAAIEVLNSRSGHSKDDFGLITQIN